MAFCRAMSKHRTAEKAQQRRLYSRLEGSEGMGEVSTRRKTNSTPYLLMAPAVILLVTIILIPVLYTLWLSFHSYTWGQPLQLEGLDNYRRVFADSAFWRALINNIVFVTVVVYGELLIGIMVALFFTGAVVFKKIAISIVMAPYAVSTVIGVLMWRFLWNPDIGIINAWLSDMSIGQLQWPSEPIHAMILLMLIAVWLNFPFTFLILYNALLGVNPNLIDSGRVDGCSSWQVFRYIKFPTILPAVLVVLMFRYIFAFRTFDVVWILTKGGPYRSTELLSVYLYRHAFNYYEFGVGAAVAWIMVLLTLALGSYYFYLMYKRLIRNDV